MCLRKEVFREVLGTGRRVKIGKWLRLSGWGWPEGRLPAGDDAARTLTVQGYCSHWAVANRGEGLERGRRHAKIRGVVAVISANNLWLRTIKASSINIYCAQTATATYHTITNYLRTRCHIDKSWPEHQERSRSARSTRRLFVRRAPPNYQRRSSTDRERTPTHSLITN